ncbi:hypothetical protein DWB61_08470 [Ancylomarina euxinus]|uniref:Anti-sigma factor n=1 Tax=Ancylomarina euxinus TaxID=2283627 RepID=A0A425Y1F3_9BACT|nr:hypothetical protein [Ancylomarina euxinus]MCZ4695181.1 hypothetical protein [Ancylomarina euxinus]MUP14885.1 hypothetical protein [Ancylomarina euxinus]RRG21780.1 hypothetical protein DWB61_08470 [Ancylomarina euxinus]
MNDIEKIIKQHQGRFDSEEPRDDHFDRFNQKMQLHHQAKARWQWKDLMKIAAMIAIVAIAGLTTYQLREIKSPHLGLGQLSPEYQEVENYFKASIDKQLDIISQLTKSTDIQEQNTIKEELADMDKLYKQLEDELKSNPKDERIIQAMIEHFQVKNNILNRIVQQLYLISQQDIPLADILSI